MTARAAGSAAPTSASVDLARLAAFSPFTERLPQGCERTLDRIPTLQVNVGKKCNLACKHCHVEAGPDRTEIMGRATLRAVLDVFMAYPFTTLDITGGAPELNPDYEWFIAEARAAKPDAIIMTRSNLCVLDNPALAHLLKLWARLGITVVTSLPYYKEMQADRMRGSGTFASVITHLKELCALGYGKDAEKELDLVFNPQGAIMPPNQASMEAEYRRALSREGIVFNNLFAIANNPLGRFGAFLEHSGNLEGYMGKLMGAFNPAACESMMCRSQISVGYDGRIYDCDFNQVADLEWAPGTTIAELAADGTRPLARTIAFGNHCYACTAGAGSSCGGATA